jgi:hypothetical protein
VNPLFGGELFLDMGYAGEKAAHFKRKDSRLDHFFAIQGTIEILKTLDIELLPNSRNSGDLEHIDFKPNIAKVGRINHILPVRLQIIYIT